MVRRIRRLTIVGAIGSDPLDVVQAHGVSGTAACAVPPRHEPTGIRSIQRE